MKPQISVIICTYNSENTIKRAIESILKQDYPNYELIVVDDLSMDNTYAIVKSYSVARAHIQFFRNKKNRGAAYSRNSGIKQSKAKILAFTDADCEADEKWLSSLCDEFKTNNVDVVMGKIRIPKSNFIGDAISVLGFPGGGNLGFEKMWMVNDKGFTDHVSSCNFAVRRDVFKKVGLFNEYFPKAGAEDTEFSYRLKQKGLLMKYSEKALVWHSPRTSLRTFVNWHIERGRSNYFLKHEIRKVKDLIRLRVWSSWNVLKNGVKMPLHFPLILFLLFLSFFLQLIGYILEQIKNISVSGLYEK